MANDPVLIAWGAPVGKEGERRYWERIGAAYPHDKGAGLTLVLDYIPQPFDGRIVLLEISDDDEKAYLRRGRMKKDGRPKDASG